MKKKVSLLYAILTIYMFACTCIHADSKTQSDLALKAYNKVNLLQVTSNINVKERHELLIQNVVNKYPKTEPALDARLEISEHNYREKYSSSVPMTIWNQGLYRIQKEFLKHHSQSIKLLLKLAELSFYAYPDECVKYCLSVISIDSNSGRAYYLCGKAYQLLGRYEKALSVLEDGKDILTNKILGELRKKCPYWDKNKKRPKYYDISVNHAKVYFRKLGYDAGKDVDYDLIEIIKKNTPKGQKFIYPIMTSYTLTDNSTTPIYDLWVLDYILYHIKHIKLEDPIFTPYKRVPVTEVPLKSTELVEIVDR